MCSNSKIILKGLIENYSGTILENCASNIPCNIRTFIRNKCKSSSKTRLMVLKFAKMTKRRKVPKNKNYVKLIHEFPNDIFYNHFRMNRDCFAKLLKEVSKFWQKSCKGRPQAHQETALYMALWWLGNKNSLREISDRFNTSMGWVHHIVIKVCKILSKMAKTYISWPDDNELANIIEGFKELRQENKFPSVPGCVDGTHIRIRAPNDDTQSYYNRKGYHSMILQGICDHKLLFRDVFFGWPGSSHDALVWSCSPIGKALAKKELRLPNDAHLLGDSAYPLLPYLITPFRDNGHLSRQQKKFNYLHSSVRVSIEQAYGILKAKFQILNCLPILKLCNAKYIVLSCVVLHNFIRLNSSFTNISVLENILIGDSDIIEEVQEDNLNEEMQNAVTKREVICEWLVE